MDTKASRPGTGRSEWKVLRGTLTDAEIHDAAKETAAHHSLDSRTDGERTVLLGPRGRSATTLRWQVLPPQAPSTMGPVLPPQNTVEILVETGPHADPAVAARLYTRLSAAAQALTPDELAVIAGDMPLVHRYSTPEPAFRDWALLFRDHFVEHSVGLLLGMERAGIPAEWIYAFDKGDRTYNRDRVRATFRARGYRTGVLDNSAINAPGSHAGELKRTESEVDAFIDAAHEAGRKVLVIDDGGFLARGYGSGDAERRVDAAIELTVSGIKRISAVGNIGVPILNMARSQVKTLLGYREIADSCFRRLRTILPDRKFIGRPVLLIGYGTLGSRLAPALRSLGCRVDVVDSDLPTLITAAEAGYTTYRSAGEALHATDYFLVIGTTGELALSCDEFDLLPEDAYLAPFATRDFSLLTEGTLADAAVELPGVGYRYRLASGRSVTLLGNGRSMNLFEAPCISNQGYDAYLAGVLIAARRLCADPQFVPPGLHLEPTDGLIEEAGLFDAYYDRYLAVNAGSAKAPRVPTPADRKRAVVTERSATSACVVGYGVAGRIHTRILGEMGAEVAIIDPKHQDLPKHHRTFPHEVGELPAATAAGFDLWSICCPTAEHLPVLKAVLEHNPEARVLLEKPACQGHELAEFSALLRRHPKARLTVTDQYRHSTSLPMLASLIDRLEPGAPVDDVSITFSKDRTSDIALGRFVDRTYGVLGYEWVHMLAVLSGIVPEHVMAAYLSRSPESADLWATYDPRLFVSALTERTIIDRGPKERPLRLELASSILGPSMLLGSIPQPGPEWQRQLRAADDRQRHVSVRAGSTRFALHLDPVTAPDGWQLARNNHRLTAVRGNESLHDEVLRDSPMDNFVRHAVGRLLGDGPMDPPDLAPLHRIANLADALRRRAPVSVDAQPAGS